MRGWLRTHQGIAGIPSRNRYGALSFETSGSASTPVAITELFRNGEIWAVSQEFAGELPIGIVVAMDHLRARLGEALQRFVEIAGKELKIPLPYEIEMGAVGLAGAVLSLPANLKRWQNDLSEPIYERGIKFRRSIHNASVGVQRCLVAEFIKQLYDLANVTALSR